MNAAAFAQTREAEWKRLAEIGAGPARRKLTPAEVLALPVLYREALADLARLRTLVAREHPDGSDETPLVRWLNDVVARAHGRLMLSAPVGAGAVGGFFVAGFPRAFRRSFPRIALSGGVLALGLLVAFALASPDLATARRLAGPQLAENAEHHVAASGQGSALAENAARSAFYVSNNVRTAFSAFALGIAFAAPTLILLLVNGWVLGVSFALTMHLGRPEVLLVWIVAHGPLEFLAIFTAAAAGMSIGLALIAPGPWARLVALRRVANEAIVLVGGAAAMLAVAALLEGFVAASSLPWGGKAAVGAATALALLFYLRGAGREAAEVPRA